MFSKKFFAAALLCVAGSTALAQQGRFSKNVNPFIGTGGHGHTFPGVILPFGMMQLSPDTRLEGWDGCSGYHNSDSIIYGFSHTHLSGTGCSDYGDILLMPATTVQKEQYASASHFSKKNEHAEAGYYSVFLDKPQVKAELTGTVRCGMHRYSFPKGSEQDLVLDLKHRDEVLDSKLEIVDSVTLRGYRFSKAWADNQKVFFEIKFSKPFNKAGFAEGATHMETHSKNIIQCLTFKADGKPLLVKVAISAVDEEGAHKNMVAEMPGWDFDHYKTAAAAAWDKELSEIDATGGTADQRTIFYTALYHSMSAPNIYNDVDGRYRGRDDKLHSTDGKFNYYTVFSLWDTYRAENPLITLIDPKRASDFINTFILEYEQGGELPVWELSSNETYCMIAYHAVPVIWDAWSKNIGGFDKQKAFEASKHSAMLDHFGQDSYRKYGYIRADDESESVSKTLEMAYDDWCIAQMARSLNKQEDYAYFMKRSQSWKNVYDPTTGFMRARKNGSLAEPFSPFAIDGNYTEANSWQYSFYVPQDIPGLIAAMGGKDKFEAKLDALFHAKTQTEGREQADVTGLIGQYAHGNEPSHHIAYLYDFVGKPEKSREIIKHVIDSFYRNDPDGLIGNEDCGQMSAWYVLSAMGHYPVCPGSNQYQTGCSIFSKVVINPTAPNAANINQFFSTQQQEPMHGDAATTIVDNPYITGTKRIFKGSQTVTMGCLDKEAQLFYSLNGAAPVQYSAPFTITDNAEVSFYAQKGNNKSFVQQAAFNRLPEDRTIVLHSQYNNGYSAGGPDALIDGIHGTTSWRTGGWQGYQGDDFEGVVVFKQPKDIHSITASFLQDQRAWIFYPKEVSIYTSTDSTNWTLLQTIPTNKTDHDEKVTDDHFTASANVKAQYVKVVAKNFGPMPQWHEGRGNPTFIFIDEIDVK